MVSKTCKRTLKRSTINRRGSHGSNLRSRGRKSPPNAISSVFSSIDKTLFNYNCMFVRIITELTFTNLSIRHKSLKKKKDHIKIKSEKKTSPAARKFSVSRRLKFPLLSSMKRIVFDKLAFTNTLIRYKGEKNLKEKEDNKKINGEVKISPVNHKHSLFIESPNPKLPPLLPSTKRTIFLDLDETLVHSSVDSPPKAYDFMVKPNFDGVYMEIYVLKRPGVDTFLTELAEKYEIVVFTAGLKEYASLVIDEIDTKGVISHRLYRDSCTEIKGKFVKDLSSTGRELERAVLIDDNPDCYTYQPHNAIPIKPFIDDLNDDELGKLSSFLLDCDCYEDMRDVVEDYLFGDW